MGLARAHMMYLGVCTSLDYAGKTIPLWMTITRSAQTQKLMNEVISRFLIPSILICKQNCYKKSSEALPVYAKLVSHPTSACLALIDWVI